MFIFEIILTRDAWRMLFQYDAGAVEQLLLRCGLLFSFLANRSLQENGDQKVESRIEEVSLLIVVICFILRTPFHSFDIEVVYLVLSHYS